MYCAEGVENCCTNENISNGIPVPNGYLVINFENSDYPKPQGELNLLNGNSTDNNGKLQFEFLDNGQTGNITVSVNYEDEYGNSPETATESFIIQPVEEIAQLVTLVSDPLEYVIVTDTTVVYETNFTTIVTDENGASVPNVNVEFYNNWENGTLSNSSCVTTDNGTCSINLISTQSDIGSAKVVACVEFEELARAFNESYNQLQFSWIEEELPSSIRSKSKLNKQKNQIL